MNFLNMDVAIMVMTRPLSLDAEYDQRFRALLNFEAAHPDKVAAITLASGWAQRRVQTYRR